MHLNKCITVVNYSFIVLYFYFLKVFVKKKKKPRRDSFVGFDLKLCLVISENNDKRFCKLYDISGKKNYIYICKIQAIDPNYTSYINVHEHNLYHLSNFKTIKLQLTLTKRCNQCANYISFSFFLNSRKRMLVN